MIRINRHPLVQLERHAQRLALVDRGPRHDGAQQNVEVADAIEGTLLDLGQRVHRPAIITEKDGSVHLEEYQEPVLQTPKKNKKKEKPAYER